MVNSAYFCQLEGGIHKYYDINTQANNKGTVTSMIWKQKQLENKEGYYLLRTTPDQKDEQVQWTIYNTIRELPASVVRHPTNFEQT